MENEDALSMLKGLDSDRKVEKVVEKEGSVSVAKAQKAKLFMLDHIKNFYYTNENTVYVKINIKGQDEIINTDSSIFEHWLRFLFESIENTVLSKNDIKTAVSSIKSIAYFKGIREDIHLRIAEKNGKVYIDLCNERNQVLEIDEEGFRVLNSSPVLFRRTTDMAEIPIPVFVDKNDYLKLGRYLNFRTVDDLNMIVSFLLGSFRPSMPKPILNLTGEAGSGKSMNTRIIRMFIDPAKKKNLLKKEINMSELPLAAQSQYLMAYDNLSGISKEGSDLLCVVSTGGVMTTRKLYTDTDEIIIELKKVVILNGIDEFISRQDLVSRTIFIVIPKLQREVKRTEAEIWESFEADYPYILGSLVNAVSVGLKNKGKDTSVYPRMIDFGRFIAECSEALGWKDGYWQTIYPFNQAAGIEQSIGNDPFALAVIDMMEMMKLNNLHQWTGTSSKLLEILSEQLTREYTNHSNEWPKYNQVKSKLRRIAPLLEFKGILWSEERNKQQRLIVLDIKHDNE